MTKVTLTRRYSAIGQPYIVGNYEHEGNAVTEDYILPEGYTVAHDWALIRDPDGIWCEILLHPSGRPQLISLAGKINDRPVLSPVGE